MIKTKKGLSLPVAGEPKQEIDSARSVRHVAVLGEDYPGMKPTMQVVEGDTVSKGQVLFTDKKTEGVAFTAPQAGKVVHIHRGAKRALLSVVIEVGEGDEVTFDAHANDALAGLGRDQVTAQLTQSGAWTALRTRPFARIPLPGTVPNSIFVTAMDTNPLAAEPLVVINENPTEFSAGLDVLTTLTDGAVHVCHEAGKFLPAGTGAGLQTQEFSGPHPAGLAGTHIHFIDPVSANKTVWYLNYQDVIAIGYLFLTGKIYSDRVVSLAGPGVSNPRLLRTQIGADLTELTAGELADGGRNIQLPFGEIYCPKRKMTIGIKSNEFFFHRRQDHLRFSIASQIGKTGYCDKAFIRISCKLSGLIHPASHEIGKSDDIIVPANGFTAGPKQDIQFPILVPISYKRRMINLPAIRNLRSCQNRPICRGYHHHHPGGTLLLSGSGGGIPAIADDQIR